jgi:hypothetical protein
MLLDVDRVPGSVQELLHEGTQNTVNAAVAVHRLAERDAADELRDRLRRDVEDLEANGDRITHDLIHDIAGRLAIGAERGALLALAEAIDEATDRLFSLAEIDADPVPASVRVDVAAVLRDIARVNANAVQALDRRRARQQSLWGEAERLVAEGRQLIRRARANAMRAPDPLAVVRADRWLSAARRALDAAAGVSRRLHAFTLSR